mgnify:CR=1 FL=1
MLITLGACGASLVWLGMWPALSRRTERLARRRIEATLPMSVAEFASERDQLRAAIAVKEARIEKQAEALGKRHAEMVAEVGRANARLAALEHSYGIDTRREGELTAELDRLRAELAETSATLDAERGAHASAREQLAGLDDAHRNLGLRQESLSDAADERRVETAALQAEREALLGRLESIEAAQKSLRAERAALAEAAESHRAENAELQAEREAHLERIALLEGKLRDHEAGLDEVAEIVRQNETEKADAEARASDLATRLAASDAHGARLALDLDAAKERLASLASLHEAAQRQAAAAMNEFVTLRQSLDVETERAERSETAERLHVANAVTELRKLEEALESEQARFGAMVASLEETRAERDRLQARMAKLAARPTDKEAKAVEAGRGAVSSEELAARKELVAMIERLADEIAAASGAAPLPPIVATRSPAAARAAAE